MSETLLNIAHLHHRYDSKPALTDIHLEIVCGETFGLLGPNGSGKSTLLSILSGLISPSQGEIWFNGVRQNPIGRQMRAQLGVIFQNPSLDPKLKASENLLLAASLYGLWGQQARKRAGELLTWLGLLDHAGAPVKTFSGGMKRRLDIARALMHSPTLLIMDEPTAGLDEQGFAEFWRYLRELRKRQELTLLLSTHLPQEALHCDRLALMHQGHIQAINTPEAFHAQSGYAMSGNKKIIIQRDPHLGDVFYQITGSSL